MVGTGRRTWGCTPFSHAMPKVCNKGDSQTGRCGVVILVLIVRAKVMRLEGQAQFARVYERPHCSQEEQNHSYHPEKPGTCRR